MIDNKKCITVGIPTYNSSKYLTKCIKSVIKLKNVDEIIISDDGSRKEEVELLEDIVNKFKITSKKKIILLKNDFNSGAYVNKYNLFKASKNELVYILDSDNIASKNLDNIISILLSSEHDKDFLIQPNIMYQFYEFPKIAKLIGNFNKKYKIKFLTEDSTLNMEQVKKSLLLNSGEYNLEEFIDHKKALGQIEQKKDNLIDKWIFWILNCGNFIANKDTMLEIAEKGLSLDRKIRSVDAIVFSYLWLKSGKSIKIYKNFYHHHRKRNDSVSFNENEDSKNAIRYFIKKVLEN